MCWRRFAVAGRNEGDLVTEPGEGLLVVPHDMVAVSLIDSLVVVLAGFSVILVVLHHAPGDTRQGVRDRDGGLLLIAAAEPAGQPAKPGPGPAAGAGGGPG